MHIFTTIPLESCNNENVVMNGMPITGSYFHRASFNCPKSTKTSFGEYVCRLE